MGNCKLNRAVTPSPLSGQVCLHGCFVNEDNAFRLRHHGRNTVPEPVFALPPYLGTAALGGDQ